MKSTRGFALKSTHGIAIKSTNMASADKGESMPVRRNTRQFYDGEESCYIIDAKLEGNLGRYLNVSLLFLWVLPGHAAKGVLQISSRSFNGAAGFSASV